MKKLLLLLLLITISTSAQDYSEDYYSDMDEPVEEKVPGNGQCNGHNPCDGHSEWHPCHINMNEICGEEPIAASVQSDFFVGLIVIAIILFIFSRIKNPKDEY